MRRRAAERDAVGRAVAASGNASIVAASASGVALTGRGADRGSFEGDRPLISDH
ncbi:hypothetical protein BURCENBC7_AP2946 [Burkholderia cenocepacia BC7]|nr:hypothetical protein BURCENK562V_C3349 [Burkholderia cenocepacia K56-2Valvano]ERI28420.1 hypothetical protein BURCENBC7_AP2946 [Burkholderia cenocepacia BC7]